MDGISPDHARNATALSPRFVARPPTNFENSPGCRDRPCRFATPIDNNHNCPCKVVTAAAAGCVLASPPLRYRVEGRGARAQGAPHPKACHAWQDRRTLRRLARTHSTYYCVVPLIPIYGTTVFSFHMPAPHRDANAIRHHMAPHHNESLK